jgi:hypothetical protein
MIPDDSVRLEIPSDQYKTKFDDRRIVQNWSSVGIKRSSVNDSTWEYVYPA